MEFANQYRKSTSCGGCCVSGCDSKENKNFNLSFHRVPKLGSVKIKKRNLFGKIEVVDKRSEWLKNVNVKDSNVKNLLVCSLHFNENDYWFPELDAKKRSLKRDAIPRPWNVQIGKINKNMQRQKRLDLRCSKKQCKTNDSMKVNENKGPTRAKEEEKSIENSIVSEVDTDVCEAGSVPKSIGPTGDFNDCKVECENHDSDCEQDDKCVLDEIPVEVIFEDNFEDFKDNFEDMRNTEIYVEEQYSTKQMSKDKSVQVTTGDFQPTLCSFIKSEKELVTMCNIKSLKILDKLTQLIDKIYPIKKHTLLSTRESIILTTAKLKLDISFSALAILFNKVSDITIRNVFHETVIKLSTILQSVVRRVPKEEMEKNIPKCFEKFSSTTSFLDCTEIRIQKPKCLKCRLKFYSHYNGDVTVKCMTEVTPEGIIVCISESFGGHASDKCIFNHTDILPDLESTRDSVMVDKGFFVDQECMQKNVKLIRPPFLRKKKQFSEMEAVENQDIACARVHIERMNQRIKQFEILNHKFPWHLINYIDDIFLVCCGLANLGTPILADKF